MLVFNISIILHHCLLECEPEWRGNYFFGSVVRGDAKKSNLKIDKSNFQTIRQLIP